MSLICYHASHEQFAPSQLLRLASMAEQAGFQGIHSSDHFHPWAEVQGQSGFSFSWLGAAMQATSIPFSVVCAPGQRYHPAIVAQAAATLEEMFPGRFSLELGSGEALNENITGEIWPDHSTRNERLQQCAEIIRQLLRGEQVTHDGLVTVRGARLFTLPQRQPPLFCAAMSTGTAGWAGPWADGLLTTVDKDNADTAVKIRAFRDNGGEGKPVYVQFSFAYGHDRERTFAEGFEQWRNVLAATDQRAELPTVAAFENVGRHFHASDHPDPFPIFTDMEQLCERLSTISSLGVDRIILHNITRQQELFIDDFRRHF